MNWVFNKLFNLLNQVPNLTFVLLRLAGISYYKYKPFDDGKRNLTFYFSFGEFGIITKSINFIVDTKKPIVRNTLPRKGFVYGNFSMEFQEVNPKDAYLVYGNSLTGYENASINFNKCQEINHYNLCKVNVDINEFDGEAISYYFSVSDISNKVTFSDTKILQVDLSPPVINKFNYTSIKGNIEFYLDIDESNFDKVQYIDNSEKKPNKKTLCNKLKDRICIKKVYFKRGFHDITIIATDKAGNSDTKTISFTI